MPDRRRRTAFRHPLPERSSLLMRERQSPTPGPSSSSASSSSSTPPSSSPDGSSGSSGPGDDNPFAPPPEDRPDQPWQPRHPVNGGKNGEGDGASGDAPEGGSSDNRPVWGSQWSSHQPGRQNGTFGGQPTGPGGPNGQGGGRGGPEGSRGGLRWDPTDPVQRRARYSLLSGMWAFFFALFDLPEIALLLGALATYWSISALRAKPKEPSAPGAATGPAGAPGAGAAPSASPAPAPITGSTAAAGPQGTNYLQRGSRQQTTAAVSGLATALIALSIVATTFTVQLVYRDYYTCVNDSLTKAGQLSCNDLLPKPLEPFFGVKE
ncbi:hypothetical protein [Streptomyces sp. NBC_01022]|uniref:hypothetical protein n=1 Tax=Streptomyces sp. NBC_01022 TaxID=2903723 RepID=UPI002DD9850A|nr:hypothetical protein [Streptomyces sp. NBC_01022]WRZ83866.1 hypothetical protein OG316_28260 [Streptomyces sp. NBC_01022]